MKTETIQIQGMSCHHCVMAVQNELSNLDLEKVHVTIGQVVVEYDESQVSREEIIRAIEEAGYQVAP
ncbi:heavy-metal-associated domain-containing protein [candidate division KSB1 bacterium]|nr:heavy-metal-associated domain-containing protein [candidate division KSB1 bacterium]